MKRTQFAFQTGFRLGVGNDRSQCAVMVLARGGVEGDSENRHRGADQWLYVVSGTGAAKINGVPPAYRDEETELPAGKR